MATASKPFVNASISPSRRAISWCPITATKIALVFVATTDGSPRFFIQIVNFVDGVPVYAPPCLILLQTFPYTMPSPRIVYTGNNRLLFSVAKVVSSGQPNTHSFVLAKLNGDDTVEFLAESADLVTMDNSSGAGTIGLTGGDGSATVMGLRKTGSNSYATYWPLDLTGDKVTIGNRVDDVVTSPSATPCESTLRTALDGRQWVLQNHYSSNATTTIRRPGVGQLPGDRITASERASMYSKPSGLLPIRDDQFLMFYDATAYAFSRIRNSGGALIGSATLDATIAWRSSGEYASGHVEDTIWLDPDGTFVQAYAQGSAGAPGAAATVAETTSTLMPLKLYVARYDEVSKSIQQAADFPIDMGVNVPNRCWDRMLHKVDKNTLAVVGSFAVPGQTTVQHGIIMVKS